MTLHVYYWDIGTFEDLFHFTTMHLATLLLETALT
jgi:hypothetical protein